MPRIITPATPEHEISEHNSKMFGSPKERLDFYRREIQYETSILANRLDAYLAAQSFLVIAFVSSMRNLNQGWGSMFIDPAGNVVGVILGAALVAQRQPYALWPTSMRSR